MNTLIKRISHSHLIEDNGFRPIRAWADATTDATSMRRKDLLRDKSRAVVDFFQHIDKQIDQVRPADVKRWQLELENRGLAHSTIYGMVSRVSSFYNWAINNGPDMLRERINFNPVDMARPKSPKSYQSESTKSLADDQAAALLQVVKARADDDNVVGRRDYAMLLFYLYTGMRRQEVANLRWGNIRANGVLIVSTRVKGGEIMTMEVREPSVKVALLEYLKLSDRLETMDDESPLWTRHDRAGLPGKPLSTHSFACNLKSYAQEAGIGNIHLHQLRHTFARIAAEESGSLVAVQEALGHKNLNTTRVYVQRVGLKRDRFSELIAARFDGLS